MKRLISYSLVLCSILTLTCSSGEFMKKQNTKEFVPAWAKEVVWYQVFPERFRNGDASNDPSVADIAGADPQDPPKAWKVHDWGSDWYELQDYELLNGETEMWKHLLRRRYGGDLQGVIDKLDYLQDLGITAIYMNPVFTSPSLHKYDGESYHHIDPNFGPNPAGDRELIKSENPLDPSTWVWTSADKLALKLIKEAHVRDMRIIFDGVFNHLGINSFAFKDVIEKQEESPYKDWFTIHSFKNGEAGTELEYEGWFGVKSLPELRENENGIVQGPKDYIFAATERWMNPRGAGIEHGIDGWRLDVAFCIKHAFWKDWRKHVRSINPQAYMTAEIIDTPEKVKPYMQGDEFDAEMNYNFAFASAEFFFNENYMSITASEYDKKLQELREHYPKGVAEVSMNLFGSHDANRIGSHIVNRKNGIVNFRDWGQYFGASKAIDNPKYSSRKPNAEDIELQKLFVIMQMSYVGAPMIYYGDEVGMWGANDPDCRKPMIWDDIDYDDEIYHADGSTHEADKVEINQDLLAHYKKMIAIRNENKALQIGTYKTVFTDDEAGIFAFERKYKKEIITLIINNGESDYPGASAFLEKGKYKDLLTGETLDANSVIIAGKNAVALKR